MPRYGMTAERLDRALHTAETLDNFIQNLAAASSEITAVLKAYEIPKSVGAALDWPEFLAFTSNHYPELSNTLSTLRCESFEVPKYRKRGNLLLAGNATIVMSAKLMLGQLENALLKFAGKPVNVKLEAV